MTAPTDPVLLTQELIRCPSVTPTDAGALGLIEARLQAAGFACHQIHREGTPNLFARWGGQGAARSLGFNGHTDVVPAGDAAKWSHPPFAAEIEDGVLYGRGANDMKAGVAAFVAAAVDYVAGRAPSADQAIVITLTGDEEGPAQHGTRAILDWMAARGERM